MSDWFGDLDTFLYFSGAFSVLGVILPWSLFRTPGKPLRNLIVTLIAGPLTLGVLGAIASYLIHMKRQSEFYVVFSENFVAGLAYIFETGIELVALGLMVLLLSAMVVFSVDFRRMRSSQ